MDSFTNEVVAWLFIAKVSYILTPLLLLCIFIAVLMLIKRLDRIIIQQEIIIQRLLRKPTMTQLL